MTDASTLASAFVSAVAVVVSPLLIGFALSPAEPDLSQLQQQDREALDASRRVLALSEDCVRRVEQIESSLNEDPDTQRLGVTALPTTSTGD